MLGRSAFGSPDVRAAVPSRPSRAASPFCFLLVFTRDTRFQGTVRPYAENLGGLLISPSSNIRKHLHYSDNPEKHVIIIIVDETGPLRG